MSDLTTYAFQKPASPLRRFVDSLQSAQDAARGVTPFARAGLHTLRAGGTSLLTGSALGFVHGRWSLDVGKSKRVPIDGVLALAGAAASLFLARDPDGLGVEARTIMTTAGGIFAFRKTSEWQARGLTARHHERSSNDNNEDPVMAAARGLEDVAAQ